MLNATRGSTDWLPALVWAATGLVRVSDGWRSLARPQWIFAPIHPGLVAGLFGYIIQAELFEGIPFFRSGRASVSRLDAFYLSSPGPTDAFQVIVDMMLALATLAGGFVVLRAINDASFQSRRVARGMGLSLFSTCLLEAIGLAAGGILFWIVTLGRGWSWGALFITAGSIAAGLARFRSQAPWLYAAKLFSRGGSPSSSKTDLPLSVSIDSLSSLTGAILRPSRSVSRRGDKQQYERNTYRWQNGCGTSSFQKACCDN